MVKKKITLIRFFLCLLPFSISVFGFIAGACSGFKSVAEVVIFIIYLILDAISVIFCSGILLFFGVDKKLK